jgi:hypothetical protein
VTSAPCAQPTTIGRVCTCACDSAFFLFWALSLTVCVCLHVAVRPVHTRGSPLGRELVHTIMSLMFIPGYTMDAGHFAIWVKQLQDARTELAAEAQGACLCLWYLLLTCVGHCAFTLQCLLVDERGRVCVGCGRGCVLDGVWVCRCVSVPLCVSHGESVVPLSLASPPGLTAEHSREVRSPGQRSALTADDSLSPGDGAGVGQADDGSGALLMPLGSPPIPLTSAVHHPPWLCHPPV